MRTIHSRVLAAGGAVAAGAAALTYSAYRKEMDAARRRINTERQVIDSAHGTIEFGECGDGPAVLVIHGAGGGFDQGLELGRAIVGDGYRVIAPSRFGYLGTALPADATAEAQAAAHLRLLDALQLERVPVVGVSAGAPSAMRLCLEHPERCAALVLMVPLAWAPERTRANMPSPFFANVLNALTESDFLFWAATKIARMTLLQTILGTPVGAYRNAGEGERRNVDRLLHSIVPISSRAGGIRNDAVVADALTPYALEAIRVPTLIISAADCLYGTYESSYYTAEEIPNARFAGFSSGGHLLLGHDREVRALIANFLAESLATGAQAAMAI